MGVLRDQREPRPLGRGYERQAANVTHRAVRSLAAFKNTGRALTAADAHGDHAVAMLTTVHFS